MFTRLLFSYGLIVFSFNFCFAQLLDVTSTNNHFFSAESMLGNFFLGTDIEVIDIVYQGNPRSVGHFKDIESNIFEFSRGLIVTTGLAASQNNANLGINGASEHLADVFSASGVEDSDLESLAMGETVHDVSIYTITFIPKKALLSFDYIFGSEEYPEDVCFPNNDVFGFFLSGPGINGSFENNAENIALIPDTNIPVSINSINSGEVGENGVSEACESLDYSAFYRTALPTNPPVYDGFTTVLTAQKILEPCQVYTLKIAIGDVGNPNKDSGLFLANHSFKTTGTGLETSIISPNDNFLMTENCSEATLHLELPVPVENDYSINIQVEGTATRGLDYENIPTTVTIPSGTTSLDIPITSIEDELQEDIESLIFIIEKSACLTDTLYLYLSDDDAAVEAEDVSVCEGGLAILGPNIEAATNSKFIWESDVLIHPPNQVHFFELEVSGVLPLKVGAGTTPSICIDSLSHPWINDIDLYIFAPDGQYMELSTDNGGNGGNGLGLDYYLQTCFTEDAIMPINFPGVLAPADGVPFTGNWLPEGEWSDLHGSPTNGTWRLAIIDDVPDNVIFAGNIHTWSLDFQAINPITYEWSPETGLSCTDCPNPTVIAPAETVTYTLTMTDNSGCQQFQNIILEINNENFIQSRCPEQLSVPLNDDCQFRILDYAELLGISDNCSFFNIVQSPAPDTLITEIVQQTISIDIEDENQTYNCSFIVELEDVFPPTIHCPEHKIITFDETCIISLADYTSEANVSDNCDTHITQIPAVGTEFHELAIETITLVADDGFQQDSCTFTLLLRNTVPYSYDCPENDTVYIDENCEAILADYTSLVTMETGCSFTFEQTPAAGININEIGTIELGLNIPNYPDEEPSCHLNITVLDTIPAEVICPGNKIITIDDIDQFAIPDYTPEIMVTDNCPIVSYYQVPEQGTGLSMFGMMDITIGLLTASNETSECTFQLEVLAGNSPPIDRSHLDINSRPTGLNDGFSWNINHPQITVYPNPVQEMLWIEISDVQTEKVQITLTDILGKLLLEQSNSIHQTIAIPTNELAAGVYFLKVNINEKIFSRKILKE